ncbi:nitrile hydratase [Nakamurella sp.]|uniref:nitrile hydratase n=1 Tax=Nakamurella sp. TaxID=1869182 RepID=UPI0037834B11
MNDGAGSGGDRGVVPELEQALTALAWDDPAVAADPAAALARLGVDIPDGMLVDIRIQRPDTLYLVIPPVADSAPPDEVVNQMDLWRSGDQFVWIMSQDAKLALLQMRRQYRAHGAEEAP